MFVIRCGPIIQLTQDDCAGVRKRFPRTVSPAASLLLRVVCYQRMHRVWPASQLGAEWKSLNAIPLQVTELRARERRRWGIQDHLGAGLQPEFKLNCWYIWYIWLLPLAKVRKVILGWMYTDFCMDKSSKQLNSGTFRYLFLAQWVFSAAFIHGWSPYWLLFPKIKKGKVAWLMVTKSKRS